MYRRKKAVNSIQAIARLCIQKYVDPATDQAFWFNNQTGATSWSKPAILGSSDVKALALASAV